MVLDTLKLSPPQRRLLERLVANVDGDGFLELEVYGSEVAIARRLTVLALAEHTAGTNAAKARKRGADWLALNPRRGRPFSGPSGYSQRVDVRLRLETHAGLDVLRHVAGAETVGTYVREKLEQLVEANRKVIEINLRSRNPRPPTVDE